jgi:SOS-response transcriptional repressor LexA
MQSPDLWRAEKGGHLITMSEALTLKQQAVRDFIGTYQQREGVSPSLREIQAHFGFASPNAAAKHLAALRRKGVVQRSTRRARGLVLSESADRLISVSGHFKMHHLWSLQSAPPLTGVFLGFL